MIRVMRYPGGKGKCYQRLINLMPPHSTYIESHLGAGAVMRNKRPASKSIGIDLDGRVIEHWRCSFPGRCTLVHADATVFLSQYKFAGGEFVYSDPPYVPGTRRKSKIYRCEYTEGEHVRLLDVLTSLPCMVMISGYKNPLYGERLAKWRLTTFLAKTHVGLREECVWMNFEPPKTLHDASYLGDTFRQRQSVRRRQQRLVERFGRMEPAEREHLLRVLDTQYGREGPP